MIRSMLFVLIVLAQGTALAANCQRGNPDAKGGEPIVNWYDNYIRPFRYLPPDDADKKLSKGQVEEFIEALANFNRSMALDQMALENLVTQIVAGYAREPNFKGIDNATVEKIYRSGSGSNIDFSLFCVSARTLKAPDDAFAVTLFGVVADDCQHVGMRGIVFTSALINGSPTGQCRTDQFFRKMVLWPLLAGTNEVTFICGKDVGGCARQ